jgi:Leucine-rich repeat (LRR) protein
VGNQTQSLTEWNPFHTSHWPRMAVRASEYDGGERLQLSFDLGAVPENEKKTVMRQWCEVLSGAPSNLRWLNIWTHATQPLFDAACQNENLECLMIKWSNIKQLDQIKSLKKLKYLYIGSSTKIESIEPLAVLKQLEYLHIENFKLITDFTPLSKMASIKSLNITGSMWSFQQVDSLEFLSKMVWLKSLAVDTHNIHSLRPLANLKALEDLHIGGRLPMEEYARLAAQLPSTSCRWFSPYYDLSDTGIGMCKRCNQQTMVMLSGGKGAKTFCRSCDAEKVKKHEEAFNIIKNDELTRQ